MTVSENAFQQQVEASALLAAVGTRRLHANLCQVESREVGCLVTRELVWIWKMINDENMGWRGY